MAPRSQSSHRFRCYREIPNERAEVPVSELTTMSITVAVVPPVLGGLSAFVLRHLPSTPPKSRGEGRRPVVNKMTGDVHGTLFQIGHVNNMNLPDGR